VCCCAVTAAVAAAAVVVIAHAGQKKMFPSLDQIKSNGQFVIDLLAIDPAVKDAKKIVKKGVDLRAPIPATITLRFRSLNVALDNVSVPALILASDQHCHSQTGCWCKCRS
jgi:hypothetical protein